MFHLTLVNFRIFDIIFLFESLVKLSSFEIQNRVEYFRVNSSFEFFRVKGTVTTRVESSYRVELFHP